MSAIVVTWVSQLSFSPTLIGIALESEGGFLTSLVTSGRFTLSILPREGGKEIAKRILKIGTEPGDPSHAALLKGREGWVGVPNGAMGALYCSVVDTHACGDHTLVIAEVREEERWMGGNPLHLSDTGWKYQKPGADTSPPPKN